MDEDPLRCRARATLHPAGRPDKTRRAAAWMTATPRLRRTSTGGSPLLAFLHDPALGLPARLLLAPLDPSIAVPKVEPAERVGLDLEDGSAALVRVVAVNAPARARCGGFRLRQQCLPFALRASQPPS